MYIGSCSTKQAPDKQTNFRCQFSILSGLRITTLFTKCIYSDIFIQPPSSRRHLSSVPFPYMLLCYTSHANLILSVFHSFRSSLHTYASRPMHAPLSSYLSTDQLPLLHFYLHHFLHTISSYNNTRTSILASQFLHLYYPCSTITTSSRHFFLTTTQSS